MSTIASVWIRDAASSPTSNVLTKYVTGGCAKAWCLSSYAGGVATVTLSFNITSVTHTASGFATHNLTAALASNIVGTSSQDDGASGATGYEGSITGLSASSYRKGTWATSNVTTGSDNGQNHSVIHGTLA